MLYELHWFIDIKYKIILLTYKALHGMAPSYICDMLQLYHPKLNLRSANKFLLSVPRTRLVTGADRSFSVIAPKLWNQLPLPIRSLDKLDSFKCALKTFLFTLAFHLTSVIFSKVKYVFIIFTTFITHVNYGNVLNFYEILKCVSLYQC